MFAYIEKRFSTLYRMECLKSSGEHQEIAQRAQPLESCGYFNREHD